MSVVPSVGQSLGSGRSRASREEPPTASRGPCFPVAIGRRCAAFRPRAVRCIRGSGPGAYSCRWILRLGLGSKPVVSDCTSRRDRGSCVAVLVRDDLSVDHLGNGPSRARRRYHLCRHIHLTLARRDSVLPGSRVGICGLLYGIRRCRCRQLVLGSSAPIWGSDSVVAPG